MKKKSTQRLMPDEDTLNHTCLRANYLALCQNTLYLHCQPVYCQSEQSNEDTVIVMILTTALKQTQQNLKMIKCF